MKKTLACLLSFALIFSSVPPDCFSQLNPGPASRANPLPGNPLPGKTLNSAWELQRWLLTFPEFSRNPAGAAHVVLRAAPQFEAKKEPGKPWIAKRQGGKIFLLDEDDASRSFSVDLSLGDASQAPARLVRELQEAQELDSKYGTTGHVMRIFSLFYDDALMPDWALEKNLPSEVRVPVETRFPETPGADIWAALERRVLEHSGLKSARSRADSLKIETASILRNDPKLSLKDAFTAAFAKVHALSPRQSEKIRTLLDHPFLTREEEKPLPLPEGAAYTRVIGDKDLPEISRKSVLMHGRGLYSLGYGRVWWHKDDGNYRTELAFSPYGVGRYPVIPILPHMGRLIQAKKVGERLYLATTRGIWLLTSIFEGLPDWSGRLLKDVEAAIKQIQRRSGTEGFPQPSLPDSRGGIPGPDGRTLFNGFQNGMRLLLGLAGAGILEGLSRLAASLGSLSLGWVEEGMEVASGKDIPEADLPPPAPKDFQGDVWPVLEEKIGKELQLKLLSGGTQEWKKEAARTLRNEPGLELYEALARSFAKAHRLDESTAKKARSFLEELGSRVAEGEFFLELQMEPHRIYGLAELNGKTYLKTEEGLLAREEGRWNRETPGEMGPVMGAEFLDGRLYAAPPQGVWVKEGNRWELSLDCGVVHRLRVIGGRLYAASVSGLWALERGRWVLVLPEKGLFGVGGVHDATELDGKLYAAGDSGVYVLEEKSPLRRLLGRFFSRRARWKRELKTSIFSLVRTDETLYALGHRGLYGKSGGGWERELGYVRDVVKFNGTLYAGGPEGLYAKEGGASPHPAGWSWPYPGIGQVKRFSVVQGRLYAQTQNGLYMKQGGDWARVKAKSEISSIEEADGEIYLKTEEGLGQWVPDRRVPANWQKPVLQDVEEEIGRLHRSAEARPQQEPPPADEDGSIRGEDGRTLFNGFQGSKG